MKAVGRRTFTQENGSAAGRLFGTSRALSISHQTQFWTSNSGRASTAARHAQTNDIHLTSLQHSGHIALAVQRNQLQQHTAPALVPGAGNLAAMPLGRSSQSMISTWTARGTVNTPNDPQYQVDKPPRRSQDGTPGSFPIIEAIGVGVQMKGAAQQTTEQLECSKYPVVGIKLIDPQSTKKEGEQRRRTFLSVTLFRHGALIETAPGPWLEGFLAALFGERQSTDAGG